MTRKLVGPVPLTRSSRSGPSASHCEASRPPPSTTIAAAQGRWRLHGRSGDSSIAEPATLVVRVNVEDRTWLLEEAPETYYLTDYYRPHPVVLVRLARIDRDALGDVLSMSRRLTLPKARARRRTRHF